MSNRFEDIDLHSLIRSEGQFLTSFDSASQSVFGHLYRPTQIHQVGQFSSLD